MSDHGSTFRRVFNFKDNEATGRTLTILYKIFFGIANTFVTGTFYTAFLAQNGIDIVRVGIMTFIPYFCWVFALFTPIFIRHFKRRRGILLFSHVFYYSCIILATTVMPNFVQDPGKRTLWFAFFLILGNSVNSLISNAAFAWQINFLPDGTDRNYYFSIQNMIANVVGALTALGASFLADSLADSPKQAVIINDLRYISFAIILVGGIMMLGIPKEYPYKHSVGKSHLRDVFTIPLKNKKFMLTLLIAILWNAVCSLNANTWTFYLLNTVHMSYTLTYLPSLVCTLASIFLLGRWRSFINRYGWYRMIFWNVAVTALIELLYSFTSGGFYVTFILAACIYGINFIGAQINFNFVTYYHMPKTDTDTYITLYRFTVNLGMFFGSMIGTWMLSGLEGPGGAPRHLLGCDVYGSQLLLWIKVLLLLGVAAYIWLVTPKIRVSDVND